jgi:hypothetical protein
VNTIKLSRDPAVVVEALVASGLGVLLLFGLPDNVEPYYSAVILAVGGLLTAAWVKKEKVLPAVVGFIKAVFALVVGLGVAVDPNVEVGVIMVISALATFFVRTQATAPITVDGVVLSSHDHPRLA